MGNVIQINGVRIEVADGESVSVVGNRVMVGGKSIMIEGPGVTVSAMDAKFDLKCDGDIVVMGDIRGSATAKGNVHCSEIGGSVTADGDVICEEVGGSVTCKEATVHGDVGGSIISAGRVKR